VNPATNGISHEPCEVRRALVARGARHSANRQRRLHESGIFFSQSVDQVIVIPNSRIHHLRFAFVPFPFWYKKT
jgi:hypothetical protein